MTQERDPNAPPAEGDTPPADPDTDSEGNDADNDAEGGEPAEADKGQA